MVAVAAHQVQESEEGDKESENNALNEFLGDSARRYEDDHTSQNLAMGGTLGSAVNNKVMASTLRNLSGTFKEAKAAIATGKADELSALNDDYEDDFNLDSVRQQDNHHHNLTEQKHSVFASEEPQSDQKPLSVI
jgi:hypothetical protein